VVPKNGLGIRRAQSNPTRPYGRGTSIHGIRLNVMWYAQATMRLSKVAMIGGLGVCVALSACGGTSAESKTRHNLSYSTTLTTPAAVTTKSANERCLPPTTIGLNRELVPGTPCSVVLSRYAGLPAHVGTKLVGRVELRSPPLLRRLTNEFNALPPHVTGTIVCPNDRGSEIVAILKYPHRQDLRLTVTLTGCSGVLRGSVTRSALGRPGAKLIGQLERLVSRRA
jgi:hypothetical protein